MDDDIRNRLRGGGGFRSERPMYTSRPQPLRRPSATPIEEDAPLPLAPPKPSKPPKPLKVAKPKKPRSKKKLRKLRRFLLILIILGAVGYGAFLGWKYHQHQTQKKQDQTISQAAQQLGDIKPTGTIRLIATGDNFTFDSVNTAAKKADGSYDYAPQFAGVKPYFDKNKADIRVCNESIPAGGTVVGVTGFPNFNAPSEFAKGLGDLGCNVINMATAHMSDKGQAAINSTVGYWDNQPDLLAAAGANRNAEEQAKIHYFTVKNVKFAFLAYTTTTNAPQPSPFSVNAYSDALADKQVTEARKNAQFVIVSINWGKEDSADITPDQDRIAQHLADAKADLILGTGTHVLQPAKILTGADKKHQTLAWFSLGNFLNSQLPIENLIGGIAVVNIDVATQNIKDPEFLPVYMHYEWTAEQKKRASAPDLAARHNLGLYVLDTAASLLAKSQNGTTVEAQTARVTAIITKFAPIKVIKSSEY